MKILNKKLTLPIALLLAVLSGQSHGAQVTGVIKHIFLQDVNIFGTNFAWAIVQTDPEIPSSECTGGIIVDPDPASHWGASLYPSMLTAKAANLPVVVTYTGSGGGVFCTFVDVKFE